MAQNKKFPKRSGGARNGSTARVGSAARKQHPDDGAARQPVRHPGVRPAQLRQDLQASGQSEGNPGMLVIALLATTAFMFLYFHFLALTQMSQLTGGLTMPDLMLTGYGQEYIAQLDGAMDDPAHGQLNWTHKTAGVIFPLMMGLSVVAVAAWCLPRGLGRWLSYGAAALFVVLDIAENIAIEAALNAGGPGAELASTLTVLRWVLLIGLTLWIILLLVGKARRSARAALASSS